MKRILLSLLFIFISTLSFAAPANVWQALAQTFKLKDQSNQPEVKNQIKWLLNHPSYFHVFAQNSAPYIFHILEEIKKRKLPGELALMPMIESNYNPFAYSHVGAAGLWQLMPGTGSGLGIKQNWWYDGRRGIVTSTNAALNHLTYLSRFFSGNWVLAIAAYDAGEGTVQKAMRRNHSLPLSTNFWSLALPRETKAYLPRLMAMASLIKYPRYFGISLPQFSYGPYFSQVPINKQINIKQAAKLASISYDEILKLNPGYNRWTTSPVKGSDFLLLPTAKVDVFNKNINTLPESHFLKWTRYEVKRNDNLSTIALKNNARVKVIKELNHLNSDTLKIGMQLIIPKSPNPSAKTLSETKRDLAINHAKNNGPQQIIHVVKEGDSLSSISEQYHVTNAELIYWNRLKGPKLTMNQKIEIWKEQAKSKLKTYQVKAGDSLEKIAHKFQLSLKQLKMLNPKTVNDLIKPKQTLVVG